MTVKNVFRLFFILFCVTAACGCTGMAASAEEYFSIGMAYYDLGKYDEAERWLNRARQADRTMTASQYNLGRLAFERQRYDEAARHFESILRIDPDNVLALKAAAYTRIRTGDIETAEIHYSRLLTLIPESADDGYNHALVLYAMGRYSQAEEVLERYSFSLHENRALQLLYARSQSAQNKVEAIDSYANYLAGLTGSTDSKARYEYAGVLEYHEIYARALEEYRTALSETSATAENPGKADIRFAIARVLLIADSESREGITEMEEAISGGFDNIAAVEELITNVNISAANSESLRNIVNNMRRAAAAQEEQEEAGESP